MRAQKREALRSQFGLNLLLLGVGAGLGRALKVKGKGETPRIKTSETRNRLSNLRNTRGEVPLNLDDYGPGSAFSGVYDVKTGVFLASPSGSTRTLDGAIPDTLVRRNGGHLTVNRDLSAAIGENSNRVGFFFRMENDGSLAFGFKSGGINSRNPNFDSDVAPSSFWAPIMDAVKSATGRTVRAQ